jgi:transglutaminase-like putative cysteine protease
MRLRLFLVVVLLLSASILSGCTLFSDDDEDKTGDTFSETQLDAPSVPSYPPREPVERPQENESQLAPGFAYNITWEMGEIYANWGGFIRITIENSGVNDLFIYRCGILVNWTIPPQWILEDRGILIPTQEEKHLGLVYFAAPNTTGDFTYNILISLLVKDNELFDDFGVESWYDNGTVQGKDKELFVIPMKDAQETKLEHNLKYYQDKLQERVDFDDPDIQRTVTDVISDYKGKYNIYQVLAIFDYMGSDLTYISDPEGRDYWAYCSETLSRKGGDCEDLSILFSSMVGAIGGTTRIYLTKTHAFPALYVGSLAQKNAILSAIEDWYGTEPNFVIFAEESGYWLVADPAGSLYMGGLPADCEPAFTSYNPLIYGFNFKDTTEIHAIDIIE